MTKSKETLKSFVGEVINEMIHNNDNWVKMFGDENISKILGMEQAAKNEAAATKIQAVQRGKLGRQAAVEAKLADPATSAQEKEDILEALREVHAGVQPLRDRTVSGSVQTHRAGFRPSEQHAKLTKEIAQSIERITGGKQSERAVEARERRKREARAKAAEERTRLEAYKLQAEAEESKEYRYRSEERIKSMDKKLDDIQRGISRVLREVR